MSINKRDHFITKVLTFSRILCAMVKMSSLKDDLVLIYFNVIINIISATTNDNYC